MAFLCHFHASVGPEYHAVHRIVIHVVVVDDKGEGVSLACVVLEIFSLFEHQVCVFYAIGHQL